MRHPSFRLRIAALTVGLSGLTLVGFSLVAWWLILEAKLNRLDGALEGQLARAGGVLVRGRWTAFEQSLPQELGLGSGTAVALQSRDRSGELLYQSASWPPDLPLPAVLGPAPLDLPTLLPPSDRGPQGEFPRRPPPAPSTTVVTVRTPEGRWRVGIGAFPQAQVTIAVNLAAIHQEMGIIQRGFGLAVPGAIGLIALGAWGIAAQALRPVRQLTAALQRVTAQGLDQRLPTGGVDQEFVALIAAFNHMLERLERSFRQATRFSGDAAHELKTPLAILQGHLERSLQTAAPGSPEQQQLSLLLEEVQRLSGIVRKLLLLSLADAGQMSLQRRPVDLSALLSELATDIELLAPDLTVQTDIAPGLATVGDLDLLTQLLQNLISNAVKYNCPQGWVQLLARAQGGDRLEIRLVNASTGPATAAGDRLFERFYRQDSAHSRQIEGTGLGLSLAREIARAHGGDVVLDQPAIAGQTSFTLRLPAISPPTSETG